MRTRSRRVAEELESLLEQDASPDEVSGEARRLATLATTVVEERPGPVATLTEDRRLAMRDRLLDDIAALEAPAPAAAPALVPRAKRRARAAVATGVASALIAGTGVTVAAQEALPGDVLYGLKKGTESVRMNLASDATQAARLELRFAEERLQEITAGAGRAPAGSLVDSLAEMDRRSLAGAQQLVLAAERSGEGEWLAEVDAFVERQSNGIVEVFARLPVEVRPHAEDSLATLREIRSELLLPAIEACDCLDIVPAGHTDGEFVPRMTSDPLPPRPQETEPRETADTGESTGTSGAGSSADTDVREPIDEITRERTTSGDSDRVTEPLRETTDRVRDTVDDTVDRTTDGVRDTVDRTTDRVRDTVDDTTRELDETVDRTTDRTRDTVEDTSDSVGDLLDSTSDRLGDGLR